MKEVEYLNDSVWCRVGASKIHGVGVFAIRDIKKGQKLSDYDLQSAMWNVRQNYYVMDEATFSHIVPEVQALILDRLLLDKEAQEHLITFISPNRDAILQSFMNHSDQPNSDGAYALCDISKGEEITEDFRKLINVPHDLTRKHMSFIWK